MRECRDLMACEECDALYQRIGLGKGESAFCQRCGACLDKEAGSGFARMLPLTLACLILFVIANAFPIVEIEMQGLHSSATLLKAVDALYREGREFIALLVLLTTFVMPLGQLLILLYLVFPIQRTSRPYFAGLLRFMQILRPWGMVEVFLLGIVVAIVKLSNMVVVIPDIALWAFGALTILMMVIISFNLRYLWDNYDQAR